MRCVVTYDDAISCACDVMLIRRIICMCISVSHKRSSSAWEQLERDMSHIKRARIDVAAQPTLVCTQHVMSCHVMSCHVISCHVISQRCDAICDLLMCVRCCVEFSCSAPFPSAVDSLTGKFDMGITHRHDLTSVICTCSCSCSCSCTCTCT